MQIHDGRTIARAVNGAIATPRLGFLYRKVPGGVYVGRTGTERCSTLCTSVSPVNYHSTNDPYSIIRHYEINNGTVSNRNSTHTQSTPTKNNTNIKISKATRYSYQIIRPNVKQSRSILYLSFCASQVYNI